jgi:5-methylthioadenosine/S-adenosylhomocysteine deaminase
LLLIKNGLIVSMDQKAEIFHGSLLIESGQIKAINPTNPPSDIPVLDATGFIILPGFIQTHIHLCQTLFRNLADDLPLIRWLKEKIWPLEGSHTPDSLRLSAQLGISELLLSGTTTIMDMGTVHHMDVVFEEIEKSGIRAFCGKTMMDSGDAPDSLLESTDKSIQSSVHLMERWHNKADGRIKYAFAPRFLLSCSEDLITETAKLAENYDIPFHSHAAETGFEIDYILDHHGMGNIQYFERLGAAKSNLCLAHCIWPQSNEKDIIKQNNIKVLHCPSSNLKLGSGIAPIPEYLDAGINVSLGADGAPCNNNLNIFQEMRLAALIQKPIHGPESMSAKQVVKMATIDGAKALNLENEIGSIEKGKKADLVFIESEKIQTIPFDNIYAKLVYSTNQDSVTHVMVDGKWVVKDRKLCNYKEIEIKSKITNISKALIN